MYKSTAKETIEERRESSVKKFSIWIAMHKKIQACKHRQSRFKNSPIRIATVTVVQRGCLYRTRLHVVEIWNVAQLSGLRWSGVQSSKENVARGYRFRKLLHRFLSLDRLILRKEEVVVWRIIDWNYSISVKCELLLLVWIGNLLDQISLVKIIFVSAWNDSFLKQLTLGIRGTGFIFLVFFRKLVHGWIASIDVTVIWILITSLQSLSSSKRSKRLSYY